MLFMAESVPLVRLTKDGLWAVCSRVECGERFAMRVEASDAQWAKRVDTEVDRANRPRKATLDFLAGWVLREGTWEMSQRARIRLSQGRQPAFRRPPFLVSAAHDSVGFARREWDFEKKKWVRPDRDVDSPEHFSTNEESLPAFVLCLRTAPACRSSGASLRLGWCQQCLADRMSSGFRDSSRAAQVPSPPLAWKRPSLSCGEIPSLLSSCPNLREVSSFPSTTRHQPFPSELQRGAHAPGLRRVSPSQCLEKAVMMRPRVPPADLRQGI